AVEAVALAAALVPVGPAVAEVESIHRAPQEVDAVGAVLDDAPRPRVVRRRARILHVEHVVAEPPEANEVVKGLPSDAAHRVTTGQVQHQDAATGSQLRPPLEDRQPRDRAQQTPRASPGAPRSYLARRSARLEGRRSGRPCGPSRAGAR